MPGQLLALSVTQVSGFSPDSDGCSIGVLDSQSAVRSSRAAIGDGTSLHVRRPVVRPWKGRILITMGVLFPYGFSSVFKGYFDLLRSLSVSAAQLMFQSKRLCLVWLT